MRVLVSLFSLFVCTYSAHAVISLDGSSLGSEWVAITYVNTADIEDDQQTGGDEADLVGGFDSGNDYFALYKQFDYGTGSTGVITGDEQIAFRTRVSGDDNPTGFQTALWLGIDLNVDGNFDYFIGLYDSADNGPSAENDLGLYKFTVPGSAIDTTKKANYTEVAWAGSILSVDASAPSTMFRAASSVGDPTDLDDGGATPDYLVQYTLSFNDLAAALFPTMTTQEASEELLGTAIGFGLWTSQNLNQVNNDVNGIDDASSLTPSNPYTPDGTEPVPEPATYALLFGLFAMRFAAVRRRR